MEAKASDDDVDWRCMATAGVMDVEVSRVALARVSAEEVANKGEGVCGGRRRWLTRKWSSHHLTGSASTTDDSMLMRTASNGG